MADTTERTPNRAKTGDAEGPNEAEVAVAGPGDVEVANGSDVEDAGPGWISSPDYILDPPTSPTQDDGDDSINNDPEPTVHIELQEGLLNTVVPPPGAHA